MPIISRIFDVTVALLALVVLAPVMLVIAAGIAIAMRFPVLFRQERVGLDDRVFTIYKFRTMTDARDAGGKLLPNAARLTRLGRFLRAASLDELPQLLNVLNGDMSLVGPRPLFPRYLPRYNERQRRRHLVRPGITGWAQIHGRNALSWEDRFEMDVWYVDHHSLLLDLKILLLTVWKVLRPEGPPVAEREFFGSLDGLDVRAREGSGVPVGLG